MRRLISGLALVVIVGVLFSVQAQMSRANKLLAPMPLLQTTPVISRPGVSLIQQLTAAEDVGAQPLFEWQAVEDAARYVLLVIDTDGRAYWSWEGAETAVYLGGGTDVPPEDSAGPKLLRPMTWMVFAFDEAESLIGVSASSPITP
jgi:hypothetical protein